jgi:hypothetical protein
VRGEKYRRGLQFVFQVLVNELEISLAAVHPAVRVRRKTRQPM